jgi:hypothetical protein
MIIVIQQYKPKNAGVRHDPSLLVEYMIQGHVQYAGGRFRPERGSRSRSRCEIKCKDVRDVLARPAINI